MTWTGLSHFKKKKPFQALVGLILELEVYTSLCLFLIFKKKKKFCVHVYVYMTRPSYPPSCLIIVKIHQQPCTLVCAFGKALLPLTGIHELPGEPIAIVEVVSAAAPKPISGKIFGASSTTAPTAGKLTLSAGPAHSVHHSGGTYGIRECRFSTACRYKYHMTFETIQDKSKDPNFVLSCPILKTLRPMRQEN